MIHLLRPEQSKITRKTALAFAVLILCMGCGTTTQRLATEQLLISDAVDQAISQIDFRYLEGRKVFVDTLYLRSVKGVGFVNSDYIISSLRQQLTAANCLIQDDRESADVIVEPRVGALGTDGHEVVYGLPQSAAITSAAAIFSGSAIPPIPEVSVGKLNAQSGVAKVIVFAYDSQTREPVWQSGIAKSESTSSNSWFLGAGPFQKGSIYEGRRFAGQRLPPSSELNANVFHPLRLYGEQNKAEKDVPEEPSSLVNFEKEFYFKDKRLTNPTSPSATNSPDQVAESDDSSSDFAVEKATFKEDANKTSQ